MTEKESIEPKDMHIGNLVHKLGIVTEVTHSEMSLLNPNISPFEIKPIILSDFWYRYYGFKKSEYAGWWEKTIAPESFPTMKRTLSINRGGAVNFQESEGAEHCVHLPVILNNVHELQNCWRWVMGMPLLRDESQPSAVGEKMMYWETDNN